ncbi:MAG TPA: acyl-CoA dehydratase activase [Candidatus Hydrogenedens sp.]|nr:acyl-CoA dehydratase activase [Candidatus Hydrogenedens sp.]
MSEYFVIGLDIGSATAKAVLVDNDGKICAYAVRPTGGRLVQSAEDVKREALSQVGVREELVKAIITTGYGRDIVQNKTKSLTEITCHAKGAYIIKPEIRFVIDIGGQDSKAILLEPDGQVGRFEMNDKCAAGTGRFLEVMARTLGIHLDEMGDIAVRSEKCSKISSTCTVFAESEVISLLAQGEEIPSVVSGLCRAIAERVYGLASRVGITSPIMMTGGVAKNKGVVSWLSKTLKQELIVPEEPQIIGALGASMIGVEWVKKNNQAVNKVTQNI